MSGICHKICKIITARFIGSLSRPAAYRLGVFILARTMRKIKSRARMDNVGQN